MHLFPVLGLMAWLGTLPVCAQTTAVSNLGQTYVTALGTGQLNSGDYRLAFSFTTGTTDFSFSGITLSINGSGPSSTGFSVSVYSAMDFTGPSSLVTPLTGSTAPRPAGNYSYTPAVGTTLLANTTYWLVTAAPGNPINQPIAINSTASTAEDAGALAGWSIGDQRYTTNNGGTSWTFASTAYVPQFSVQGTAIPEIPSSAIAAGFAALGVSVWRRFRKSGG